VQDPASGRETFDEDSDDSCPARKDEKSGEDSPVIVSLLRATERAEQQQNERGQGGPVTGKEERHRGYWSFNSFEFVFRTLNPEP
jgi:hypothetical protein